MYASFDEDELKQIYNRDKSKNWRTLTEVIVNVDKARSEALAKLDGIDRLVLGLPNWVDEALIGSKFAIVYVIGLVVFIFTSPAF